MKHINKRSSMKKLLFAVAVLMMVGSSFGGSYRTAVCALRGISDTTQINLQDRIDECVKENCAKLLDSSLIKTALIKSTRFTEDQMVQFALRGGKGAMTQSVTPHFNANATIKSKGNTCTDAELDSAFLYVVWVYAVLIGMGEM